MKNKLFSFLFLLFSISSYSQTYEIVVATDFDGNVVSGSIDSLIYQIRQGKPVRVGWQLDFNKDKKPDFDHWVDAGFITILGDHVFSQLEEIYIQGPNMEIPQIEIYPSGTKWTCVIGTNGLLKNRFVYPELPKVSPVDKDGKKLTPEEIDEKVYKKIEVKTWKVATFWSVMK